MAIQEFGTALLKQYLTNKLVDKGIKGIEKYTGTSSDEDKDKSGFVSQQKTGGLGSILGRALAFSLFGPVLGPLAFAGGKGILNLGKQQGLGLNPFGGDGPTGPAGIVSGKVQTLDGRIVDSDSDEARADLNARDQAFQETGDYDVYSNTVTTGPTQPDFDPNKDYYTGSDEEDRDNESNGDSGGGGGGGGGSPGSAGPGGSDEMGSFRYGGRASYSGGGLASLYR